MRLLELDLRAFRRFAGRVTLRPRLEGLTIVAGDNEEGKSSLLAALEAVLFERHNVGGSVLEAMRPWGGGDPEISVRFLLDGREWRIEKRFGRGAMAQLYEGARRIAVDAEAERRLVELLQFEPRQGRAEPRPEHRGLPGLFWVQQGTSFHGFEVPDTLRGPLAAALAAEIDLAAGGDRSRAVLQIVRTRVRTLLTPGRRQETGELKELADALGAVRHELDELERQWQSVEAKVSLLARLREDARRVARRDEIGEARRRLAELEARSAQLERLAAEVERARAVADGCRARVQELERQREQRRQLQRRLEEAQEEHRRRTADRAALARQLERAEAERAAAEAGQKRLATALAALEEQLAGARRAAERERLKTVLARTRADRDRLEALQTRLAELGRELAALRVTPGLVSSLRDALTRQAAARAALEAVATRLLFQPELGRRVLHAGREIPIKEPHLVTEPAEFLLEGFGRLSVRPGAADLGERQRRLAEAEREVAELLARAGVADLAEAEAMLRRRETCSAERQRIEAERRLLLERHEMASEAELDAWIAGLVARLAEMPAEEGPAAGILPAERIGQLEAEQRQRRAEAAAVDAQAAQCSQQVQQCRIELAGVEAVIGQLAQRIAELQRELALLGEELPEEELARKLAEAQDELERAAVEHAGLRRELDRQQPASLADELARQRRRVDGLEAEERDRREQIAALEAELRTLGASDLAGRLERARDELAQLERAYAAKRQEADAWWLLQERLEAAQRSRREALTRLVIERVQPWLRRLFPDASLEVDPDRLAIGALARGGLREPFASLSVGTREQLALLVRLALASLVAAERGDPPCVLLDDALVYADEHRFEVMQGILERAGREERMQIIIFTCRPRDWLGVEAERVRLGGSTAVGAP